VKRTIATLIAGLMLAGLLAPAVVVAGKGYDHLNFFRFRGHEYRFVPELKTWPEAKAYCEQDGGHLATIHSEAENRIVFNQRYAFSPTGRPYKWRFGSWLGASDRAQEGAWRWVTGEPMTYTNWGPGEPNNWDASGQGHGEDYMALLWWEGYDPPLLGVWNDWQYQPNGSEALEPFTCEYER
jgi:hypothetical protein